MLIVGVTSARSSSKLARNQQTGKIANRILPRIKNIPLQIKGSWHVGQVN